MLVNLVGHIASGKTRFVNWWLKRHPNWYFLSIDQIREELRDQSEDTIWQEVHNRLKWRPSTDCIFESTGTNWRLKRLWRSLQNHGIYTVRLVTTCQESQQLAKARKRPPLPGYEADESYSIQLEDQYQTQLSANLFAPGGLQADEQIYKQIERHIMRAKLVFRMQLHGLNRFHNNNLC